MVGTGVLVQSGVIYSFVSANLFSALTGGSIFVGAGSSVNVGVINVFSGTTNSHHGEATLGGSGEAFVRPAYRGRLHGQTIKQPIDPPHLPTHSVRRGRLHLDRLPHRHGHRARRLLWTGRRLLPPRFVCSFVCLSSGSKPRAHDTGNTLTSRLTRPTTHEHDNSGSNDLHREPQFWHGRAAVFCGPRGLHVRMCMYMS